MLRKSPIKRILSSGLGVYVFLFVLASITSADTLTWNRAGADDLASNGSNQSAGTAPQDGDVVIFDAASTEDCTWDVNITLNSLSLDAGYTGTVVLSTDLAVIGDINILDGTLILGDWNLATGLSLAFATTDTATDINGNAAILNGTVNPNGSETTIYFEWGTDTSYGNSTTPQSIGSGTDDVSVSAFINRLSTNTTYHYRVIATNDAVTRYGDDMSFTTAEGTFVLFREYYPG